MWCCTPWGGISVMCRLVMWKKVRVWTGGEERLLERERQRKEIHSSSSEPLILLWVAGELEPISADNAMSCPGPSFDQSCRWSSPSCVLNGFNSERWVVGRSRLLGFTAFCYCCFFLSYQPGACVIVQGTSRSPVIFSCSRQLAQMRSINGKANGWGCVTSLMCHYIEINFVGFLEWW